jgi:hypothetical protein
MEMYVRENGRIIFQGSVFYEALSKACVVSQPNIQQSQSLNRDCWPVSILRCSVSSFIDLQMILLNNLFFFFHLC